MWEKPGYLVKTYLCILEETMIHGQIKTEKTCFWHVSFCLTRRKPCIDYYLSEKSIDYYKI